MNGKYYWVKTLYGVEIGLKRDSGIWELCGVDVTVDINEAIIEVLGEVSEWSSDEKGQALHKHIVTNRTLNEKKPVRYRCLLCGRDKFTRKSPHNCKGGFRKRNIKWQPIFE